MSAYAVFGTGSVMTTTLQDQSSSFNMPTIKTAVVVLPIALGSIGGIIVFLLPVLCLIMPLAKHLCKLLYQTMLFCVCMVRRQRVREGEKDSV